jgi:putative redox protein
MSLIEVHLEGKRADAYLTDFVVKTGGGEAPSPGSLFLASIATCTALTVASYCQSNNLPTEGFRVKLDLERDPETRLATKIQMELVLPEDFPAARKRAVLRAAERCYVKRQILNPPVFETTIAE